MREHDFSKPHQRVQIRSLISTIILVVGFTSLLLHIDAMHMHPDEFLSFNSTRPAFSDSMRIILTRDIHGPLWFAQFWGWQRLVGTSEFASRMNSLLFGMLTLALIMRIGRQWSRQILVGWFAVIVLAINALFRIYTLEIRPYPLMLFVAVLLGWAYHRWLTERTPTTAITYALSIALGIYTHYYLGFLVVAQAIYFGLRHLTNTRLLRQGILVSVVGLLISAPQLFTFALVQRDGIQFETAERVGTPVEPTNLNSILELATLATNGLVWVYALVWGMGLIVLWRNRGYWLALMWLFLAPGLVLAINVIFPLYNVRYVSFIAPAVGVLTAMALVGVTDRLPRWRKLAFGVASIGLVAMSAYWLPHVIPAATPHRTLYQQIATQAQPDDALLIIHPNQDGYLADQMTRYLPASLLDNSSTQLADVRPTRRVWFISNNFFSERSKQASRDLEATHRVWQVIEGSDCTSDWCYIAQLMVAPPLRDPITFGDDIQFSGADITLDNDHLRALLWWGVASVPEADYSISLRLTDEDGTIISQLDRQIDPPQTEIGEIPTSQMQPDNSYIDERVLPIAPTILNGTYTLELVVYQWWDGTRLLLADGRDAYVIDTITINR
ncbi:MAG: glycosyltransferase family 39 protein [Anaerolineae bacterium]